ncbi:MAG: hypothetical protein HC780_25175 [Leptolyngbyaceae cyanobacterium CSU_1_3]|nr:hypothetical protein [Leptolyngbyaceae cyanobacterium CSU_1_3]
MDKPLDVERSLAVAKAIQIKAKASFENAYKAALVTEGATYVQGFLVFAGAPFQPIEHGWLELENTLLDPNLPHLNRKADQLYYFPAHRLTVKQLKKAIEEAEEDYPEDDALPVYGKMPYEYYGDIMLGGKDYLMAHQAADAKCKALNRPKAPLDRQN